MQRLLKIVTICLLTYLAVSVQEDHFYVQASRTALGKAEKITRSPQNKVIDVPLVNQLTTPALYNGCEVAALSMLLQFQGKKVTKNELAKQLAYTPMHEGKWDGNPNQAFVGDITGKNPGLGVYHGPIYKLATKYLPKKHVHDISGSDFSKVAGLIEQGKPVWVITTTNFEAPKTWQKFHTKQGDLKVTFAMHSVVITGVDARYIYLNDPYGHKNRQVDKKAFIRSYKAMGKQAIYVDGMGK